MNYILKLNIKAIWYLEYTRNKIMFELTYLNIATSPSKSEKDRIHPRGDKNILVLQGKY